MKKILVMILFLTLFGCSSPAMKREIADSPNNICGDCKKDNFKNYKACYTLVNGKRECDLCDPDCCDLAPGKRDRCCCLHYGHRNDCFQVCVTRKLSKGLKVPEKYLKKWQAWQAGLTDEEKARVQNWVK